MKAPSWCLRARRSWIAPVYCFVVIPFAVNETHGEPFLFKLLAGTVFVGAYYAAWALAEIAVSRNGRMV